MKETIERLIKLEAGSLINKIGKPLVGFIKKKRGIKSTKLEMKKRLQ